MADRPIRVLLVDDDEDDYVLTRHLLAEIKGDNYDLEWAPDYEPALDRIAHGGHDVYLLDFWLGARSGLELLRQALAAGCKGPFLMLTGQGQRELDLEAMQAGAADFLEKGQLTAALLERSIRYALERRRHAEELERRVSERTNELAQANQRLREADQLKDEFLAMLAHELRNPLAPIRNALQFVRLQEQGQAECIREAHAIMERQLLHLIRLVDDLLDVSRITRGKIPVQKEPLDFVSVVSRAVECARPALDARGHRLDVALPPGPLPMIADAVRLTQVVLNLLNNAARYTPRGGLIGVRVETGPGGDGVTVVTLRVRDSGIGIPPAMLTRIFDLFTQLDRSIERTEGGLGIGLTLVKRLTEMHGGSIVAESAGAGEGSEFVLRLPLAESSALVPARGGRIGETGSRRRLLIVDDNRDSACSLARLLQIMGNEVRTAFEGRQALAEAQAFQPEIVILDLGMPGMTGFDVARHLRAAEKLPQPLLVALTGYGTTDDRRQTREAGFDAHMVKPVDLKALLDLLARAGR